VKRFTTHTGIVAMLDRSNVDTDQIIPKQFLKRIERTGFGQYLFFDWRFNTDGTPIATFELNRPEYRNATILVARKNFGSGSSREHAVWALDDYGFRCVIAESFADIFYNNCSKNGLLPVVLTTSDIQWIQRFTTNQRPAGPHYALTVDLPNQTVCDDFGLRAQFEIDPFRKKCFLEGLDQIGLTMQYIDEIRQYESARGMVPVVDH
jgi:3-isopropylmalate/(R)-2-methylmalate dehydratase small subunit